jgi:uncharacterized membrane protein HdeD (DUF308 family)
MNLIVIDARKWWLLLLRGLLAAVVGVLAIIWPGLTVFALVILFGAYALVDGISSVFAAIARRNETDREWALVLEGILGIIAGIVTFVWPDITTLALLYIIAAWAILTGVVELYAAVRLRRVIAREWLLGLSGVLSILLGLALIVFPIGAIVTLGIMFGVYAIFFGAALIALALRLRSLQSPTRYRSDASSQDIA